MNTHKEGSPPGSPDDSSAAESRASVSVSPGAGPSIPEPITWPSLGRFFGVPLLIIGAIVGSAMIVVLTFGAPAASQQRSLDALLLALESSGGQKSMGMLLPRDKEHWQAGLELTKRLETKDREFSQDDLESISLRVGGMIRAELADLRRGGVAPSAAGTRSTTGGRTRLGFLIRALGLTGQSSAVEVLVDVVSTAPNGYSAAAMQQLGNLAHLPDISRAVGPILKTLSEASSPETKLMACTVLSVLADPSDQRVIDALAATRLSAEDGEVSWSAALALARLGSDKGKSTLLDLLDRPFWEADDRYQRTDDKGKVIRYQMPPGRVNDALVAAIDAASNLDDVDLWEMIERLESDPSPVVRQKAIEAVGKRRRPDQTAVKD